MVKTKIQKVFWIEIDGFRFEVTNEYVLLNVDKFDEFWRYNENREIDETNTWVNYYIKFGCELEDKRFAKVAKSRYEGFKKWLVENSSVPIKAPIVFARKRVAFADGKHRFAVLRDMGLKTIPVIVSDKETLDNLISNKLLKEE